MATTTTSFHYHYPGGGEAKAKEKKIRNDSGCEVSSDDGGVLGPSWGEMVSDWSFKSHSIISQEMIRMQEVTAQRMREMETADTEEERGEVAERWREQGKSDAQYVQGVQSSRGLGFG